MRPATSLRYLPEYYLFSRLNSLDYALTPTATPLSSRDVGHKHCVTPLIARHAHKRYIPLPGAQTTTLPWISRKRGMSHARTTTAVDGCQCANSHLCIWRTAAGRFAAPGLCPGTPATGVHLTAHPPYGTPAQHVYHARRKRRTARHARDTALDAEGAWKVLCSLRYADVAGAHIDKSRGESML